MKNMFMLRIITAIFTAIFLFGCGGGGGSAGTTASTSVTSTTTTATVSTTPLIVLSLVKGTDATALTTNAISKSATYFAKVLVTNASGTALPNQLVTLSTDYKIATLAGNAADATALTDSTGTAKVQISPLSLTTTGNAVLSASATVSSSAVTASLNFGTTASNVSLGAIVLAPSTIGALETSAVTVPAYVDGVLATTGNVVVNFSASCGSFSPSSASTNSSGIASSTYQSIATCSGSVALNASAVGATNSGQTITVTPAKAANMVFISAAPALMYVSSAASGSKTSVVKFQVLDSKANGLSGQSVSFALSSASIAAGVKFSLSGSSSTVAQIVTTDSSGYASITVSSGTFPTSATVMATLVSDASVAASSLGLAVASGAATQNSASLSATKLSIEAWNTDGVTTSMTMRVADRQGNPVPDGTAVNFVASTGLITGTCTLTSSACTVTYTSQGTRPANGRAVILAYLDGEESFVDLNGDNIWTSPETFNDVGTLYLDLNENGTWDSSEQTYPGGSTGSSVCTNSANTYPAVAGTCDGAWSGSIRVRKQIVVTLATSDASITSVTSRTLSGFTVWIHDTNANANANANVPLFNAMPTGSLVSARVTTVGATCTVVAASPNVVRNSPNGGYHSIILDGSADCSAVNVVVTVTTPGSVATSQSF
jgi:hypothetical protein